MRLIMKNNFLPFSKSKKLLNIDKNAKTVKGQKFGYMTAILYGENYVLYIQQQTHVLLSSLFSLPCL